MNARTLAVLAGVLGALAIAAGAFGAHALEGKLDAKAAEWFEKAARYHLTHALALLGLAALAAQGFKVRGAGWCLALGVVVFSGTLYAMALGAPRWLGAVTPIGGTLMILGWLLLAFTRREP